MNPASLARGARTKMCTKPRILDRHQVPGLATDSASAHVVADHDRSVRGGRHHQAPSLPPRGGSPWERLVVRARSGPASVPSGSGSLKAHRPDVGGSWEPVVRRSPDVELRRELEELARAGSSADWKARSNAVCRGNPSVQRTDRGVTVRGRALRSAHSGSPWRMYAGSGAIPHCSRPPRFQA